jgi:hypothetical protein
MHIVIFMSITLVSFTDVLRQNTNFVYLQYAFIKPCNVPLMYH